MCLWKGGGGVVQRVERWTLRSVGRGFNEATLRNNLGRVVYTYVPLSPSSITWYRPKGVMLCGWGGNRRPGGK